MIRSALLATAALVLAACGERTDAAIDPAKAPALAEAAATLPPLDADGLPRFRPGLWEVVTTDGASGEAPVTSRQCVGDEANAEMREALAAGDTPNCKRTRFVSAAGLVIQASCKDDGVSTEMTIRLTGSETAYSLVLDLKSILPDGAPHNGRIEGKARWLGSCPAGMKPGEEVADAADL